MDPKFLQSAEFYRRRYHNFATLLIVPLVCLIIFLVIFLCFAKKEITVISTGEVAPTKVVDVIQSYSDSSIIKNNLDNNAAVEKGDVLIEYSENASPNRQTEQKNIIKERQKREEKEKKKHQKSKKKKKSKSKKATTTKKGNLFKVTAKVKVSKKNSKLIKYGMTGKTVTVIDKKTYFDYFKDKLLHKMDN